MFMIFRFELVYNLWKQLKNLFLAYYYCYKLNWPWIDIDITIYYNKLFYLKYIFDIIDGKYISFIIFRVLMS